MIHLLVVVSSDSRAEDLSSRLSSVEVLVAQGADEAVEKLARNRRLDGVLLLAGPENAAIAAAIREDNLSPPPLFVSVTAQDLPGARRLAESDLPALLDRIVKELSA
jgi:hypothetical protein